MGWGEVEDEKNKNAGSLTAAPVTKHTQMTYNTL